MLKRVMDERAALQQQLRMHIERADRAEKEIAESTELLGPAGLEGVLKDLHIQLSQVSICSTCGQ